ncbi:carbon-nitrogen hydrolase family protein [Sphaerisporangium sp. NPDC051011]|uniref:carbon-nitrogen hydrolase family protein n=1 Tax=Sphaerisporangium sp. NPDC051011 TaxID=3155792 RepID=UPI0034024C14
MSTGAVLKAVKVAVAQVPVAINDVEANLATVLGTMREAARLGARMVVFPECALTGYLQVSLEECRSVALSRKSPELDKLRHRARELDLVTVVGYLEQEDGRVYNTALLVDPGGNEGQYRKAHLPYLGADRFVTPGSNEPVVVDTGLGGVGLSICYDLRFPEWARCLTLAGASIIAHPTNWAVSAGYVAKILPQARALENSIFLLAANRGDDERGTEWFGGSSIVAPTGEVLATAPRGNHLVVSEIDLSLARRSKVIFEPETFELDLYGDRRPDLYGRIVQ